MIATKDAIKNRRERLVRNDAKVKFINVVNVKKNVIVITNPRKPSVIASQAKNKGKIYINDPAKLDLIAINKPWG